MSLQKLARELDETARQSAAMVEGVSSALEVLDEDAHLRVVQHTRAVVDGEARLLDEAKFAASFAADVSAAKAKFMAASQVPWGVAALTGEVTVPAWKAKPSWYLVASDDRMIPPPAQR